YSGRFENEYRFTEYEYDRHGEMWVKTRPPGLGHFDATVSGRCEGTRRFFSRMWRCQIAGEPSS
ncbi:MAG: hypothetical protein KDA45_10695, partial [Planctomycetales bacterium]|nr:hypothetical protein [Planctomycetales bacterium]